jgi:hypothetical protein
MKGIMFENFALMVGTYPITGLGTAFIAKYIQETNIGVKISKKHNLWIDMGIMPSHIGFKVLLEKDVWH